MTTEAPESVEMVTVPLMEWRAHTEHVKALCAIVTLMLDGLSKSPMAGMFFDAQSLDLLRDALNA